MHGAPERVDRLGFLDRPVEGLERRCVVERNDDVRPALARAQLIEDAVLRHLEEPRRELASQREPRQRLEDAQEDLLRQILRVRAITRQAEDVVEDGRSVRADDLGKRGLVPALSAAEDSGIRLRE